MNDLHEVQKEMIRFLKKLSIIYPTDIKKEFMKMKERFVEFEKNTYEKKSVSLSGNHFLARKQNRKPKN
jgi:hypothetical protein